MLFLRPVLVNLPEGALHGVRIGFQQGLHQKAVGPRFQIVVAVCESQIIPGGNPQTGIFRGSRAAVFLVDHPHAAVLCRVLVADFAGRVCGAVIDQNDLQIPIVLRQDAAYALGKVLRHIIYRHNHRNGLIHAFSSSR